MDKNTKKLIKEGQAKLDNRIAELKGMSNKQLVWAFKAEAGWLYSEREKANHAHADELHKDLELMSYELLSRMRPEFEDRVYQRTGVIKADEIDIRTVDEEWGD